MKRVASRQRLVSWDAFDASADGPSDTSSEEEDNNEEYTDCLSTFDFGGNNATTDLAAVADDDDHGAGIGVGVGQQQRKRERGSHRIKKSSTGSTDVLITRKSSPVQTPPVSSPSSSSVGGVAALSAPTVPAMVAAPAVIPGFSWEVIHPTAVVDDVDVMDIDPLPDFQTLYDDIHLHHVMTFLTTKELGVIMSLNHKFRQLLLSRDAHVLWLQYHCQKHWKGMIPSSCFNINDNKNNMKTTINTIMDKLHIPTAAGVHQTYQANLRLLLSMTPSQLPTQINKKLLSSSSSLSSNRRLQLAPTLSTTTTNTQPVLQSYKSKITGEDLIRYVGPVGNGDRCIRSDHPLPKPIRRCGGGGGGIDGRFKIHNCFMDPTTMMMTTTNNNVNTHNLNHTQQYPTQSLFPFRRPVVGGGGGRGILNMLRRSAAKAVAKTCNCNTTNEFASYYRPFVSPYCVTDGDNDNTYIDVSPRLVAYFETSILQQEDNNEDDNDDDDMNTNQEQDFHHNLPATRRHQRTECTAIGIATKSFHLHSRMPGWDSHSFGYHGDDGGIYHSSGGMVEQFGPTFGPGDTIGCGIDYVTQGIFFTLNGRFIGYAWQGLGRDLLMTNEWYPCVGIDTNSPISMNFGSKPFQYNVMKEFNRKHKQHILPYYQFRHADDRDGLDGSSHSSSSSSGGKKSPKIMKKSRNIARRLLSRGDSMDSSSSSSSNHRNNPIVRL